MLVMSGYYLIYVQYLSAAKKERLIAESLCFINVIGCVVNCMYAELIVILYLYVKSLKLCANW